jgi:hypothetical protein
MEYIKWMESQSKVIKILLALPFLDITWAIYRLIKAILSKNTTSIVIAIIILVLAPYFWWIIDMIFIVMKDSIPFVY